MRRVRRWGAALLLGIAELLTRLARRLVPKP